MAYRRSRRSGGSRRSRGYSGRGRSFRSGGSGRANTVRLVIQQAPAQSAGMMLPPAFGVTPTGLAIGSPPQPGRAKF